MKLLFYNKDTGEEISSEYQLVLLNGELYEVDFGSADSLEANHIYAGEGWKVKIANLEIKIIE